MKTESLRNLLNKIDENAVESEKATTFGGQILAGLKTSGLALAMKGAVVTGNVVDITLKLGKVAVKSAANAPELLNAIVDHANNQLDSLAKEGQALGLSRIDTIGYTIDDAYSSVKNKFSKTPVVGDSVIGTVAVASTLKA